jgi:hypothetical protein
VTTLAHIGDPTALSDAELGRLLERLEREERTVSRRRSALHNRLDFVRAGGFASAGSETDDLTLLLETEHELSEQRHLLHRQIDALRAERSRRRPLG